MENIIYTGSVSSPIAIFRTDRIYDINAYLSSAIIGDTLNVDTFSPVLGSGIVVVVGGFIPADETEPLLTADGQEFRTAEDVDVSPSTLTPGTPLFWYVDGALHGKYYVSSVKRTAAAAWAIEATSAIGLLQKIDHNGGIYEGDTAGSIIADIIGGAFPYTIDAAATAVPVWGWLPIAKARDNLHKLLTALGINVTKDADGDPVFRFITAGAVTAVPDDRIFLGGSVEDAEAPSRVEVTEHQYVALQSDEQVTLYDNIGGAMADHLFVTFKDAPIHSLQPGGFTIHSSNANYAIISGTGTLTGRKYTHNSSIRAMTNPGSNSGSTVSMSDNTLVSKINGLRVLQRLYAYYTASQTISADVAVLNERPNMQVSFTDAFGDQRTAWIKTMSLRASSIIRAQTELVAGYNPTYYGNTYQRANLYTSGGSVTLLPRDYHLLIVLIGGGQGGQAGYNGTRGYGRPLTDEGGDMTYDASGHAVYYSGGKTEAGAGGAAGAGGNPGKVLAFELDVGPRTPFSYGVGAGGAGGSSDGALGEDGTETWIEIGGRRYSSADGAIPHSGFQHILTGAMFALPGTAGEKGGDGGATGIASGIRENGLAGESVLSDSGGAGGAKVDQTITWLAQSAHVTAGGGGGGGAAFGASGGAGGDASVSSRIVSYTEYYTVRGGNGGNGANALPAGHNDNPGGFGGNGGHGGGGGGNGGGAVFGSLARTYDGVDGGDPGAAGLGSAGGRGSPGLMIIFLQN